MITKAVIVALLVVAFLIGRWISLRRNARDATLRDIEQWRDGR